MGRGPSPPRPQSVVNARGLRASQACSHSPMACTQTWPRRQNAALMVVDLQYQSS
uniref:Uncharacterized protein n=1 Tax=Physcomitrium patens TaxID=3218 RepID=A0A2K1ICT8_PHYPA|nr:hypothetical protein PHYPA_030569 [Physcomitrium patens]